MYLIYSHSEMWCSRLWQTFFPWLLCFRAFIYPFIFDRKIEVIRLWLQTRQTFVHLQNTIFFFWWNPRSFCPCIDRNGTTMFKAQKCSKDIDKIIHVTSVVQTEFDKAMRILFVQTKQKQLLYLTIYSLPCQSSTHAFTRVPRCMRVHSSTCKQGIFYCNE